MFNCIYCVIWLYDTWMSWSMPWTSHVWISWCGCWIMWIFVDRSWNYEILDFTKNLVQWNRDTGFDNRWIIFNFCLDLSKIRFYSLTIGILKLISFGLPLSENGTLSANPTEGNCAERPKAAPSPIPTEGNCTERPKGACHTLISSGDHFLSACDLHLTTSKCLTPIVVESVKL